MNRYFKAWLLMTINSIQTSFASRWGAILFIFGKIVRFGFFFFFIVIVVGKTKVLAGYSLSQVIFFFLTFNLIDILAQALYREAYRFRGLVTSGDLDLVLVKPVHPLLRILLGGVDILDMITLVPLLALVVYYAGQVGPLDVFSAGLYLLLVANALLLATAFHIAALAIGVLTTAVDHTMWIYRDLTSMGRIPVDFYNQFIRALLTFVIPVGVMMTFPAKAFMGLLSLPLVFFSFGFGVVLFWLSLKFWNWALSRYSSASS
ncbi:MAG: ABC-2 family transporter protein [Candidatus Blackburnbacteria bacterium]|nr:ABC-2 family transporter protein [Candidatus Blackburnbacteria bacterium]